ncbi:MAG TPA: glycosyltransferase, partial [Planctomycetota bacterium]|nr:glycosyltransferase [Planctomycetota bacterium]
LISVRSLADALVDELDRAELGRTRVLLDRGALGLLVPALRTALAHPLRMLRALRVAVAIGRRAPQGLARHFAYLAEACRLRCWAREAQVDHIHVHFSTNPSDVALLCRELGGPSFSFTAHRVEPGTPSCSGLGPKIAAASFVVAICEDGRRRLLEQARPADRGKIRIVRCAVDAHFLVPTPAIPPGSRRLVCVARLCPEKGHPVLLRAARLLVREGLRFELALVGDGPDRPALELAAEQLGLGGRVFFLGWADRHAVREQLRASRALVLASFAEGLPVAIMEALAQRRPVVATAVNGVPELVEPGVCGWLVPPGSDVQLAAAMRAALTRPTSELDAMGARGAARVAALHNPDAQARSIAELLLGAQARGGDGARPAH